MTLHRNIRCYTKRHETLIALVVYQQILRLASEGKGKKKKNLTIGGTSFLLIFEMSSCHVFSFHYVGISLTYGSLYANILSMCFFFVFMGTFFYAPPPSLLIFKRATMVRICNLINRKLVVVHQCFTDMVKFKDFAKNTSRRYLDKFCRYMNNKNIRAC